MPKQILNIEDKLLMFEFEQSVANKISENGIRLNYCERVADQIVAAIKNGYDISSSFPPICTSCKFPCMMKK